MSSSSSSTQDLCPEAGEWFDGDTCVPCAIKNWCPRFERRNSEGCRAGHTGYACGQCEPGHVYGANTEDCKECPHWALVLAAWAGAGLVCLVMIVVAYRSAGDAWAMGQLVIVATHFQLSYSYFSFGVPLPRTILIAVDWLRVSNHLYYVFDTLESVFAPPGCILSGFEIAPGYSFWWTMKLLLPLIVLLFFGVLVSQINQQQAKEYAEDEAKPPKERLLDVTQYDNRHARQAAKKKAIATILVISSTVLMYGVAEAMKIWLCAEFEDGLLRLPTNPTIECTTENPNYDYLLSISVVVFTIYFFGGGALYFVIVESKEGRIAAARHHVTYARLLVDASLWEQLKFGFLGIIYGDSYLKEKERHRMYRRMIDYLRLYYRLEQYHATHEASDFQNYDFSITALLARVAEYNTAENMRKLTRKDVVDANREGFFSRVFPVLVQLDPQAGPQVGVKELSLRDEEAAALPNQWVRGICHGFDENNLPRVVTGEGPLLRVANYQNTRVDFTDGQAVVVASSLRAWGEQEGDPLNAAMGAPLGQIGKVAVDEKKKTKRPVGPNGEIQSLEDEDRLYSLSMRGQSIFSVNVDFSEPMGFEYHKRWGKMMVKNVLFGGQAFYAGVKDKSTILRVGEDSVSSSEEFEMAIIKRRIVSALLRQKDIRKYTENFAKNEELNGQEASEETKLGECDEAKKLDETKEEEEPAPLEDKLVVPLSEEDEALIANDEIVNLIKPEEYIALEKELELSNSSLTQCQIVFRDPSFEITRRVPNDIAAFQRIAFLPPEDIFWDSYSEVLSAYKSNARHFEQVTNVRKTIAVMIEVWLSASGPTVQCSSMMGVILVSFILITRMEPYDDMNDRNEVNAADGTLTTNALECYFFILQFAQLLIGVFSLYVIVADEVLTFLYLLVIFLALGLTLVTLSNDAAKVYHTCMHAIEPYTNKLRGIGAEPEIPPPAEQNRRAVLLKSARTYESAKKNKFEKEAATWGSIGAATGSSANRMKALAEHRAKLLAEKESLLNEKRAWIARQASLVDGHTVTDDIGHIEVESASTSNRVAAEKAHWQEKRLQKKSIKLTKEKDAWDLRRLENGGGTVVEAFGGTATKETAALANAKAAWKEEKAKKIADSELLLTEKDAWQRRREKGQTSTVAKSFGTLSEETMVGKRRLSAIQERRDAKNAEAERHALEKEAWEKRRAKGKATVAQDVGRLGQMTESSRRAKEASDRERYEKEERLKAEADESRLEAEKFQKRMDRKTGKPKSQKSKEVEMESISISDPFSDDSSQKDSKVKEIFNRDDDTAPVLVEETETEVASANGLEAQNGTSRDLSQKNEVENGSTAEDEPKPKLFSRFRRNDTSGADGSTTNAAEDEQRPKLFSRFRRKDDEGTADRKKNESIDKPIAEQRTVDARMSLDFSDDPSMMGGVLGNEAGVSLGLSETPSPMPTTTNNKTKQTPMGAALDAPTTTTAYSRPPPKRKTYQQAKHDTFLAFKEAQDEKLDKARALLEQRGGTGGGNGSRSAGARESRVSLEFSEESSLSSIASAKTRSPAPITRVPAVSSAKNTGKDLSSSLGLQASSRSRRDAAGKREDVKSKAAALLEKRHSRAQRESADFDMHPGAGTSI